MMLANVPLFFGMTAWFPVLESRFQWSRAQLSLAFSLTRVEGSISGPLGGYLIDKLGPRRMTRIGLLIMGGGFLLFSQIQNLWQFYLVFVVMNLGAGLGTWLPMMTVLNSWFIRRRATAMSRAAAVSTAVGVLLVPALAWSIDPDQFGLDRWRTVAVGIGVTILILAFPLSRLVRDRPEDYGQRPDGDSEGAVSVESSRPGTSQPVTEESGLTWQEAIRTRAFWLITLAHACSSCVIVTITVHLGSMLYLDRGLSLQTVGLVVATYTAVSAAFNLIGGYLGDRVPIRSALFVFTSIQTVAVAVLLFTESAPVAFIYAVIMGVGFGGRVPLTTAIRGVYFGRRAFASITGISMIPNNLLMFIMPVFTGYMYDTFDSYTIPFIILVVLSGLGAVVYPVLGGPRPVPSYPRSLGGSRKREVGTGK